MKKQGSSSSSSSSSSSEGTYVRAASHSGSWYVAKGSDLQAQLAGWLADAVADADSAAPPTPTPTPVRAIIAPHAGFSYSGPTAAYAYKHLDPARVRRVFILGPSHHVHLKACAVSGATVCETPVGNLTVDDGVRAELLQNPLFQRMTQGVDEDEHSIEMHLPYVAHVLQHAPGPVTIVPVMVGALDPAQEAEYGRVFAGYLDDPANFFVVSSDFCHWGSRFRYQPYDEAHGETIGAYIEWLDRQGMELIEGGDPQAFTAYLRKYQNTICGRHPIGVFLQAARARKAAHGGGNGGKGGDGGNIKVSFVRYAQSSHCKSKHDSSVSYASAVAVDRVDGGT